MRVLQAKTLLASAFVKSQDLESAKALHAEVIPALRRAGPEAARFLAGALQAHGYIAGDEEDHNTAIAELREAVAINTAALGVQHNETLMAKRYLAAELRHAGRFKEALPVAEEVFREASAKFPNGELNGLLVDTEDIYGQVLSYTDQLDQGIVHLKHSIDGAESLFGKKNQSVAGALTFLIGAQGRAGDMRGMLESTHRYLEAASSDRGKARSRVVFGSSLLLARKLPDAVDVLKDSVEQVRQFDTGTASWLWRAQGNYLLALAQSGRILEARNLFPEGLKYASGSRKTDAVHVFNAMGIAERFAGHPAESERAHRLALERLDDSVLQSRWKADALNGIGLAQLAQGHAPEAEATLRLADTAARTYFVNMAPPRADVLVSLGHVVLEQGRAAEALPLLAEADAYWRGYDPQNRFAGEAAYWHGRALLDAGKSNEGRDALDRASKILGSSPIASDAQLAKDARKLVSEGITAGRVSL
jgi:tetratricopeptide (TPR) repeat protein